MKTLVNWGGAFSLSALLASGVRAQEMPKGAILMAEAGQGFVHLSTGPDRYLATLQLVQQWTIVPGRLRAGPVLGSFYPGTQVGGLAGARATLKVAQGPPVLLASSFHVHLLAEYLPAVWTKDQGWRQWVGAGVGLETSNVLGLSFKLHRDFRTPATYGQFALAFNLLYKASPTIPPRL